MQLIDLFKQLQRPRADRGEMRKIPWDDADFSRRMLREHLSQDHDLASRRLTTVDHHVEWIHREVVAEKPVRILDLGCGPGLYSERLAALGHKCRGIDFSPASIEYAREQSSNPDKVEYIQGDIRRIDFGRDHDLAMVLYGEFDAFSREDAGAILGKIFEALTPAGQILIEAHTLEFLRSVGQSGDTWYSQSDGLFSEKPHFCLMANRWDDDTNRVDADFHVIDAATGEVTGYANSLQAYTPDEYRALLADAGFDSIEILPAWGKSTLVPGDEFQLLRARKP